MCRVGQARATVLKAVVCGPCWGAHGGHPAAGEIGPEPCETVTSFDPAGQAHWWRALRRQPWVENVRADGRRNLLAVARLVALYAQWDTLESRPTWAKLITRSGLSERTVARWLQELRVRGWLAHLEHGSTSSTRPMTLAHLDGNRAALYGLRIPLTPQEALAQAGERLVVALVQMLDEPAAKAPEPAAPEPAERVVDQPKPHPAGDKNGSLPYSVQDSLLSPVDGFSRARMTVDNSEHHPPTRENNKRTALRAGSEGDHRPDLSIMVPVSGFEMLACAEWLRRRLAVFARCSRRLVRHLCKPYWRAGWCGRDIVHALDHRPSVFSQPAGVLISPDRVASPTQFIRSRLRAWQTPDGTIVAGHWAARVTDAAATKAARTQVAERHGRAGAALLRAGERTLTAERIAEHGRAVRRRSPNPIAAPVPTRGAEPNQLRAQLLAEARAELARHPTPAPPAVPTTPTAGGGSPSPYERALARARAEHCPGRRRRRGR